MRTQTDESDLLLKVVDLFVWGFEMYGSRMRHHWRCPSLGHARWQQQIPSAGSLPALGIRSFHFHGAGLFIVDTSGWQFDADFFPNRLGVLPDEEGRHLAYVDPWKLGFFLRSLPVKRLSQVRALLEGDRFFGMFDRLPDARILETMRAARAAFP